MAAERQRGEGPVFATAENATGERWKDFWGCHERTHARTNMNALAQMQKRMDYTHISVYTKMMKEERRRYEMVGEEGKKEGRRGRGERQLMS